MSKSKHYQDLVKTDDDWKKERIEEKMKPWKELKFTKGDGTNDNDNQTPKKLSTTGSKWTRAHLFACRVIVTNVGVPLLPAYRRVKVNEKQHDTEKLLSFINGPPQPHDRLQHQWTRQLGGDLVSGE